MKIAITSGKGGTGKTTVSTGLYHVLTRDLHYQVRLLDCDVEEPDCHIFIKAPLGKRVAVEFSVPLIHTDLCTFCGRCKEICAFNAIILLPSAGFAEVVQDMCHGCGACTYVCPEDGAITESPKEIGRVDHYDDRLPGTFIEGRMHPGGALQTRVIRETLNQAGEADILLFDSPPGTSCPVVATVSRADYAVMVTEPTPFGLHDLKLMTETVRKLDKKHGIVINKAGLDYPPLYEYIREQELRLLGEIPFKREYAGAYSQGKILVESDPSLKRTFIKMIGEILDG